MRHLTPALCILTVLSLSTGCADFTEPEPAQEETQWEIEANNQAPGQPEPGTPAPAVVTPVGEPVEPPAEEEPPVEPPVVEAPELATCELEPIWWSGEGTHRLTPEVAVVLPEHNIALSGEDVFGGGWSATRLVDGSAFPGTRNELLLGVSASGDLSLKMQPNHQDNTYSYVLVDAQGQERALSMPSGQYMQSRAVLSQDGSRAASLHCISLEDSTTVPRLTLWDVSRDQEIASKTYEGESCFYTGFSIDLAISPNGERVAYTTSVRSYPNTAAPLVHTLRQLEDGTLSALSAAVPQLETERAEDSSYSGLISAMEFSPDGTSLHVVSGQGRHTRFSLDDMSATDMGTRGSFVSNPDTYMPRMPMSPMTWTRSGRVMASVGLDGAVELRDAQDELLHRVLAPIPSDLAMWESAPQSAQNAPVSIAFTPDERAVVVHFRTGSGMWGCAPAQATGTTSIKQVSLTGPAQASAGEPVELSFDIQRHAYSPWSSRQLLVNGQPSWADFKDGELTWSSWQAGSFELVLRAEDGFDAIDSAPLLITVSAE